MPSFEERIVDLFNQIHPLDRIARAGYVLSGVPEPESVAAHSHFLAVLTLLVTDQRSGEYDQSKALAMALTHDLAESATMDIPMPVSDGALREAKCAAERSVTRRLLDPFDSRFAAYQEEFDAASSPEARLVRGLDKVQMMLKVLMYERERKGRLDEFWTSPANFNDFGIEAVSRLFDAICAAAGRPRPGTRAAARAGG